MLENNKLKVSKDTQKRLQRYCLQEVSTIIAVFQLPKRVVDGTRKIIDKLLRSSLIQAILFSVIPISIFDVLFPWIWGRKSMEQKREKKEKKEKLVNVLTSLKKEKSSEHVNTGLKSIAELSDKNMIFNMLEILKENDDEDVNCYCVALLSYSLLDKKRERYIVRGIKEILKSGFYKCAVVCVSAVGNDGRCTLYFCVNGAIGQG